MNTAHISGKSKAVILILVIVVLFLLAVIFIPKGRVEAPASGSATSTASTIAVNVTVSKQVSEQPSYSIDVEKPVIAGLADASIQKKINDHFTEKLKVAVSEFQEQAVNIKAPEGAGMKSTLYAKMTSWAVVKNSVLTVRLEFMNYFSGAAHPLTISDTSNINLATGKDLNLIDVFDTGTDYLTKLSEYSIKELRRHLAEAQGLPEGSKDIVFFEEGASSNPENFGTFLIEDAGIRFIFTQYQVAPYVAGEQEVLIPYEELKDFLRKGALADALVK